MVSIDNVYQKVLTLANKEQRGYLTPQEFKLMANGAQLQIFDNYFHDLKTAFNKPKTDINHGDEMEILKQKMLPFKKESTIAVTSGSNTLSAPANSYFIDTITIKDTNTILTQLTNEEIKYTESNPLTKSTTSRPVYQRTGTRLIKIYPTPTEDTSYVFNYWAKPTDPNWAYVVIKGRALHNATSSYNKNFELHASEEENLVNRILQLAGIVIQKPGIVEVAMTEKSSTNQEQND